jgi:hypothetical protein
LFALSAVACCGTAAAIDLDDGRPAGRAAVALPRPEEGVPAVHGKPDFLTDGEWAGVQATARSTADPAYETARLVDYLRFQKLWFRWNEQKSAQPAAARRTARTLMQGLPTKVAQGVVGAEQAEQALEQLVDFLEPDPLKQERLLARERHRLPPQPSAPAALGQ